jgi:CheY-like chemotaxis protein
MGEQQKMTILVIDDDQHHLRFVIALLERAGYEVAGFSDPEAALAEIDKVAPRLVVTDIFMPRIDGFEVLRRVKHKTPRVPVVAMSGKTSDHGTLYLESIRMLGAIAAFAKPIVGRDLVGTVDHILGGPELLGNPATSKS